MSRTKTLSSKAPDEIIPVTFEFSGLVTAIDSVLSIEITVQSGTDASPSALILGSPSVSGTDVTQLVQVGVDGVVYQIRALIQSGQLKYALKAYLPVDVG